MIARTHDIEKLRALIAAFPVTAILGARQCGKTTLAKQLGADHAFDLENPQDATRLENPKIALESLHGLILIDEIQRVPDLFPVLRYLVDNNPRQKYLILGSASGQLAKRSSESLAGRIAFHRLGGLGIDDVGPGNASSLWMRGGFPRSYLAGSARESALWRESFISTFLERDIPQLGISIPARTLRRFWIMLAHYHGQFLNYAELGRSFGISDMTVRRYLEILEGTFMVRVLSPWHNNTKKRLVRSPKIYIADSGLFHSLMSIDTREQLLSHPKLGASWEGFALEAVARKIGKNDHEVFFWATHASAELDLFFRHGGRNFGVEIKYEDSPRITKSMHVAIRDLDLDHLFVVHPGKESYMLAENVSVVPISDLGELSRRLGVD